jgi:hypothetical protein
MRINEVDRPLSQNDLDQLETFADRMFAKVGIDVAFTDHFLDRVNDERNVRQITTSELTRLFKQEFKRYGKPIAQLGPDAEAVMKDMQTNINMPFVLRWDPRNEELDLIAKTVMRKKNFHSPDPEFTIEGSSIVLGGATPGVEKSHLAALLESGSAPGVGPIHIDEIKPTLAPLSKELGVDLYGQALGSVGKKQFSGDIDVAINIPPEKLKEFAARLEKSSNILYLEKTSVFITKVKIENYDPKREWIDPATGESKGIPEGRTGYAQLDFMPGDPGWMKTYYHSPHEENSRYKGVMRNILLSTIAAVYNSKASEDETPDGRPMEIERYMWGSKDGLVRVKRTPVPRKDGNGYTAQNKNEIIGGPWKDPDEIAKQLGMNNADDLYSFETLWKAIQHYPDAMKHQIAQGLKDNKVVQDIGIPAELG